jgi:hypothetical protein
MIAPVVADNMFFKIHCATTFFKQVLKLNL